MLLLTRRAPVRRPRREERCGNESGSALVVVIAFVVIAAVVAAFLATATISSTGSTSASLAEAQSRAAAEAGLDDAVARLRSGPTACPSSHSLSRTTAPRYRVTLQTRTATSGWTAGCPGAGTISVRMESVGYAEARGAAGGGGAPPPRGAPPSPS
jgi:Tfp pilus assembly protein PilX